MQHKRWLLVAYKASSMTHNCLLFQKRLYMKRNIILVFAISIFFISYGQNFDSYFIDKSLRIDYIFAGNAQKQEIFLDKVCSLPQWAGRRHHLDKLPLRGNGQIEMRDTESNKIIYRTSFSTLFHEWICTDEAKQVSKGFEYSYLLPFPINPVQITVSLTDGYGKVTASFQHLVTPSDILIQEKGNEHVSPYKYLLKSGDYQECIDIAILAEGYNRDETELFYNDAEKACESLFGHEPFKKMKKHFNVVAVASESTDSGVSIPHDKSWKQTAFSSHFDTFYSRRYLTSSKVKAIHDALAGIPYEHIIILANTPEYGGGGIYNAFTLTTSRHNMFAPVVVHEFGHSFGGLADEYYYEGDTTPDIYPLDAEPWEQNITTLKDFSSKWQNMLKKGTPVPTPTPDDCTERYEPGVYEGAGYSGKGIYRGSPSCRMKENNASRFCPVCQQALEKLILFYTEAE